MPAAIAQFAKAPRPGQVKTRLQPRVSAHDAAELQRALVADVWAKLQVFEDVAIYLYCDVPWAPYEQLAGPRIALQRGADLGARMVHCFQELSGLGFDRILIVGSDSPTLPPEYVRQGLELLDRADAVLGPCEDGGYYAVGCRRPHPAMFDHVRWSTAQTLAQTQSALGAIGYSVLRLPPWYDVDTVNDLERLAADSALPEQTRAWLAAHHP